MKIYLTLFSELQKNEVKGLKTGSRAQNRTPRADGADEPRRARHCPAPTSSLEEAPTLLGPK
jgi:hypothetical protein